MIAIWYQKQTSALDAFQTFEAPNSQSQFSSSDPVSSIPTAMPRHSMILTCIDVVLRLGDCYMRRRGFITILWGMAVTWLASLIWAKL